MKKAERNRKKQFVVFDQCGVALFQPAFLFLLRFIEQITGLGYQLSGSRLRIFAFQRFSA